MSDQTLRLVLAQFNPLVGAIGEITRRIIETVATAHSEHAADLVVFPELCITGYPPEDLLLRPGLTRQVARALEAIIAGTRDTAVIVGYPDKQEAGLYNACAYIADGRLIDTYYKRNLPNYGVFDEARYFIPGDETCVIDINGLSVALSICEDIWSDCFADRLQGVDAPMVINLNASPYHFGKLNERRDLLKRRARETGKAIVYVNQVGGQDELVFDGGSMVIEGEGEFVYQAPQFEEGLFPVEINYRDHLLSFSSPAAPAPELSQEESIYRTLILAVRDYVRKNGFNGVVIGLSGGVDSSLTLCIAADALGADQVEALLMPSRYTSDMSLEDAVSLADNLNVRHDTVSIEEPFSAFLRALAPLFEGLPEDVTEENIQARCRGIMLMAVSNKTGRLVLTTGNKSEMAVGYATLYGDMAGGFAPLKDLSKTMVYRLCEWRNRQGAVIPRRVIERPPSAELRAEQKDEDSLPAYAVLDPILERYIELDQSPQEIIAAGYNRDTVLTVTRMVDRNEYKRRQAAPGVKISKRAFGRDRRYPITSGYTER
ncbi:MAG: NAD+ synthase [Gammaproteobacteria bacterium]